MRTYALPLLAVFALTINACGSDAAPNTDGGRDGGDAGGRGGTTGRGGSGGSTGGSTAGTGGASAGTGGSTGGATAGTGGSTAGTGGAAAGTGGSTGGATAGTGGGTAGTGGATAGTGGRGGTGGATAGTGGRGGTGGSTAGTGGRGGSTAGTGGGTAGTGGSTAGTGGSSTAGTGGGTAGTGGSTAGTGGTGGGGGSVACTSASTCPGGPDTECQQKTCLSSLCGLNFTAANTAVAAQTAGDCKRNVCDGTGNVMPAILDSDPPANDGNACTDETCVNGIPSHPPEPARTACAQSGGTLCNGSQATPACVVCLIGTDCPGTDTICHQRICGNQNTCGFSNATAGTAAEPDAAGNCKKAVCDSSGGVTPADDNADVPADDGNSCTDDVCASGAPSHPAKTPGTTCSGPNGATVCSGTTCVQCVTAANCPGTDTLCRQRTCLGNGTCSHTDAQSGTAAEPDATGNCHKAQCNGSGGVTAAVDDLDLPVDGNACTSDVCTNGTASNPTRPAGTTCAADGSKACDATVACNTLTFRVVRLGPGTSSAATAVAIEERRADGTEVGTAIAMPTAAAPPNLQLTMSGSANSEGCLSLSGDGHYLALAGYAVNMPTTGVKNTAGNRVAGLVDIARNVNTSTLFNTGNSGDNVRAATTLDGTDVWIGGAGSGTNGGVWNNQLGMTINEVHTVITPDSVRCLGIFDGQLYGSAASGTFNGLFTIGFGTPTTRPTSGPDATILANMTAGSPFGFAMFRLTTPGSGPDTIYVADDLAGVQKWKFNVALARWEVATTLTIAGSTGFRGVAGYVSGGIVTLMASTAENSPNRLVVFTDNGVAAPSGAVVATAAANMTFRGVAVSPHFAPP